jgi:hypothetical protein
MVVGGSDPPVFGDTAVRGQGVQYAHIDEGRYRSVDCRKVWYSDVGRRSFAQQPVDLRDAEVAVGLQDRQDGNP